MMQSRSVGLRPARPSASIEASYAMSAPPCPSATQRRSVIPVRVRIHSSDVSIHWVNSSFLTTRSGT